MLEPEEDPAGLAPGLALARLTLIEESAYKSGRLELTFDDGSTITVAPDDQYKAWQFTGPKGLPLVSLPGGDLAVWSEVDRSGNERLRAQAHVRRPGNLDEPRHPVSESAELRSTRTSPVGVGTDVGRGASMFDVSEVQSPRLDAAG